MAGSFAPPDASAIVGPLHLIELKVEESAPGAEQAYAGMRRVQFTWLPEEWSETVGANWNETEILGRSEPYQVYASTSAKTVNIDFTFFAQGTIAGQLIDDAIEAEILSNVRFLESLVYPVVDDTGFVIGPAPCILTLGQFWTNRVIATDVNTTYRLPVDPETHNPMYAEVSMSFKVVNRVPKSAADVLAGQYV